MQFFYDFLSNPELRFRVLSCAAAVVLLLGFVMILVKDKKPSGVLKILTVFGVGILGFILGILNRKKGE